MRWWRELGFLISISRAHYIARRYFVVNGFDGALTMLGLNTGFYAAGDVSPAVALSACAGAGLALAVSGLTGAYMSEAAERAETLAELERAMGTSLAESAQARAARVVPVLVAAVNGAAPLLVTIAVMVPLWLAARGVALPLDPQLAAITIAAACMFGLGVFLGQVSRMPWWRSGLRALLIGVVTTALVLAVTG
ncbi:MAG: hypothetical protein JSW68_11245 [Burkholderiales bacterium]|nr:MAG: hypothetical protein JSW68_11245 [Burkholderiales bacterium]